MMCVEEVDDLPVVMERFDFSLPPLFFVACGKAQKAACRPPAFTTTQHNNPLLEWVLRLVDDPKTETIFTSRMRHNAQELDAFGPFLLILTA
jgi:hypothetical protein